MKITVLAQCPKQEHVSRNNYFMISKNTPKIHPFFMYYLDNFESRKEKKLFNFKENPVHPSCPSKLVEAVSNYSSLYTTDVSSGNSFLLIMVNNKYKYYSVTS